ncbi:MAG: DUF1330 domain-containing protein [Reichenbachiella sp.]|uniref:DUF1330 domain-containing protein n=1 Tax=Reichenbachiella sp. TaxID=2184521 RepID=UPI0029671540|nr:DUF1330 domain-containing protein [Reichenbachiella sp.]MDW3209082.1 DUF1330 domain-containing protein [Reichenbachiella sp.]
MIYITQLIFLQEGKEKTFIEFEEFAIPLMEHYGGKMIYRLRPDKDSFVSSMEEQPYEIHFISFHSDTDLNAFMNDKSRLSFIHLKDESIQSTVLVKGRKI